jgi:hypothetical protein
MVGEMKIVYVVGFTSVHHISVVYGGYRLEGGSGTMVTTKLTMGNNKFFDQLESSRRGAKHKGNQRQLMLRKTRPRSMGTREE